jgi:hypothetical protein
LLPREEECNVGKIVIEWAILLKTLSGVSVNSSIEEEKATFVF